MKSIPTIDAIMAAAREWADEPGDPNLAKLLTLVIDLHNAARHPAPGPCNVCCGMPLASGKPCICGGTGTEWAETQGLREYCFKLEDKIGEIKDVQTALDGIPKELKKIAEKVSLEYPSSSDELLHIAEGITSILPYKLVVPETKVKI